MCILQDCAKPTEEGVWWRDDRQWRLYNQENQQRIRNGVAEGLQQIELCTIVSQVHPRGARYAVNLKDMEQVAVKSGQRRPIRIIESAVVPPLQVQGPLQSTKLPAPPHGQNFLAQVHYVDSTGQRRLYDEDIARALLQSMAYGNKRTLVVPDAHTGKHYLFDLHGMQQFVVSHFACGEPVLSEQAPVKVEVEIPWNVTAMASIAANVNASMRRKILAMVVKRYASDAHLDVVLPVKAHPRCIVAKSTNALREPGNPVYEKFLDSLESVCLHSDKELLGSLLKGSQAIGHDGPLQVVFKPSSRSSSSKTSHSEENAISSFWTTMEAPLAAARAVVYGCAVQLKILVYLVLIPAAGVAYDNHHRLTTLASDPDCVQMVQRDHRLPLAEVTVSQ